MRLKKSWLGKAAALTLAAVFSQGANAALIFNNGADSSDQTYIGPYDVTQGDFAFFNNFHDPEESFMDFWVFDVDPKATGTMSANITFSLPIDNFTGELWSDNGTTTCSVTIGGACTVIGLGVKLDMDSGNAWNLASQLDVGRYILKISGDTLLNEVNNGAYSGQLGFNVPEPASVALLSLGLLGLGFTSRRRRR